MRDDDVHRQESEEGVSAHPGVEQARPTLLREKRIHPGKNGAPPVPRLHLDGNPDDGMTSSVDFHDIDIVDNELISRNLPSE